MKDKKTQESNEDHEMQIDTRPTIVVFSSKELTIDDFILSNEILRVILPCNHNCIHLKELSNIIQDLLNKLENAG